MVELQHISKWVNVGGTRTFILKDINLNIAEGQFISIMGPSGSGKSTLLNVIGMLDEASEGDYIFMGENVNKLFIHQLVEEWKYNACDDHRYREGKEHG